MTKTELKVRKALKWELTRHAVAEIGEDLELGLGDYAQGIAWFMKHSGIWSIDTTMYTSEKILKGEAPTINEIMEWEATYNELTLGME